MSDDLTTRILIEIRDEMRATRLELGERLDKTNERLDQVVEEQIRHATAIVQIERRQHAVVDELKRLKSLATNSEGARAVESDPQILVTTWRAQPAQILETVEVCG